MAFQDIFCDMASDILVNISLGNDLAPTRRQVITWTNADFLPII